MYVNYAKEVVFLAHPHAASRAIAKGLESLNFQQIGAHHAGPGTLDAYRDYAYITNVRNHWDTVTSWFYTAVGQAPSARLTVKWCRDWFKGNHIYFRLPRLFWFLEEFPGARLIRYETLQEDFHRTLGALNFGATSLPHIGRGKWRAGRPYQEIMSPEVRDFIQETFAAEIEELGYEY